MSITRIGGAQGRKLRVGGELAHFGTYALSRVAHAYFLRAGRQPHRNRAFSLGISVLFALAGHVAYALIEGRHAG